MAQHEEAERRRAAAVLAALEVAMSPATGILAPARPIFEPRQGDRTVGEVIERYRATRNKDDTDKQYGHVFRLLTQVFGEHKPMRAITDEHVQEMRTLLYQVPTNATKRYPGLTLIECVERADQEEEQDPDERVRRMAPNTVRSYLVNLSAICNYARRVMKCIDVNPVDGLIPPRRNSVEREALSDQELAIVFDGLAAERRGNSAHFWVPAILAWSGARTNEIAQLYVEDVKEEAGVPYLDLTTFDAAGRLSEDKKLKNKGSKRAVPLHPDLVAAGFLEFVRERREQDERRLFPELKPNAFGYFSHEVSRSFGRHLDRMSKVPGGESLSDPSRTMHSLRHGFRQAGRKVNLSTEIIDALGGWAASSVGARYGEDRDRFVVADNAEHMAKIKFGGFSLAVQA